MDKFRNRYHVACSSWHAVTGRSGNKCLCSGTFDTIWSMECRTPPSVPVYFFISHPPWSYGTAQWFKILTALKGDKVQMFFQKMEKMFYFQKMTPKLLLQKVKSFRNSKYSGYKSGLCSKVEFLVGACVESVVWKSTVKLQLLKP